VAAGFLGDLLTLSAKEARRRVLPLAVVFSVTAVIALAVVIATPKTWEASALIIAEGHSILKPMLEGRAVPTSIADQTALVNQVMQSKRILREVLSYTGVRTDHLDPRVEEQLLTKMRSRIRIESAKTDMIRITYRDHEPRRTYQVANKIAEIYVREGTEEKERESREAFEFISKQVKEYGEKLNDAHEKLLAYYRGQDGLAPKPVPAAATTATPTPAASPPRSRIPAEELAALRAEEATLNAQLGRRPGGAAAAAESRAAEDQYRARVLQLQGELDRLLGTYTDEHPDVKRVRRDLAAAKEELHRAEAGRLDRESAHAAASAMDDQVTVATRARLEDVRRQIALATGTPVRRRGTTVRPALTQAAIEAATVPEMRNVGQDTQLSELLRRYEATRDVYQDLLKRRENARVSMELDIEHQGLALRIHEAAEQPVTASGLRLFQMTIIGLIVALLIPIAYVIGLVRLDGRIRSGEQIEKLSRLPFLVSIPYAPPVTQLARDRGHRALAMALVAGVFAVYVIVYVVRLTSST